MKPSRNWLSAESGQGTKPGSCSRPFRRLFQQPAVELGVGDGQIALGKDLDHLVVADAEGIAQAAQNIVVGHVDSCGNGADVTTCRLSSQKKRLSRSGPGSGGLLPHLLQGILQLQQLGFQIAHGDPVAQLLLELGEQALQTRHPG